MTTAEALKLMGRRVEVSVELHPREVDVPSDSAGALATTWTAKKVWERLPVQPYRGWFVGLRTVYNGTKEYCIGDVPPVLKNMTAVCAVLVVPGPRRKPRYVPLDGFRVLEEGAK